MIRQHEFDREAVAELTAARRRFEAATSSASSWLAVDLALRRLLLAVAWSDLLSGSPSGAQRCAGLACMAVEGRDLLDLVVRDIEMHNDVSG